MLWFPLFRILRIQYFLKKTFFDSNNIKIVLLFSCVFCAAVECNGGLPEEKDVGLQSTADQEVPHPDVLPEQSTGDFDFNEFFNLEKTMPGLASVSTPALPPLFF